MAVSAINAATPIQQSRGLEQPPQGQPERMRLSSDELI
jgi:hypothetical protein